ncbi:MAG: hypothetical protein KatS3mg057_1782 [Herpetosiphonaceae bacterium]|nr:MAG: hypothetical protein KatS3mg057_1782 [Herpetosiphonaceae bacterium]
MVSISRRRILRIARRRTAHLPNVRFHEISRPQLPFSDATFDRVYSHLVLFHLDKDDMYQYLREAARVLKPGGLIYFDTWNLLHPEGWARFEWEMEHHADKPIKPAHRNRFCTPEEVRLYTEKAGLKPLVLLDESFWVQMIAARPGVGVEILEIQSRLRNLPALVPHGKWYY